VNTEKTGIKGVTERTHETENRPCILVVFDPAEPTPGTTKEV
jgi:hypothetical protein